jgi:hypothetical protein
MSGAYSGARSSGSLAPLCCRTGESFVVPISPAPHFAPDGLILGAGTILLPAEGHRRLANLQGYEARLLALLSATYGKAISPSVLGNIERAAKSWRGGDDCLAAIHPSGACTIAAA